MIKKQVENKICCQCNYFKKANQIENRYYFCPKTKEKISAFDYCGFYKKMKK